MKISIIDTGFSNIFSLVVSLKKLGYNSVVTSNILCLKQSDKLFLSGVGSAELVMTKLRKKNLIQFLQNLNKPLFGIYLGMRILCNFSYENYCTKILGILDQNVKLLLQEYNLPIPHTG